jgi:hypothetical protein
MATDRRKFLALMALGVPPTTSAMSQGWPSTIQNNKSEGERWSIPRDLFSGLKERLWDLSMEDGGSIQCAG